LFYFRALEIAAASIWFSVTIPIQKGKNLSVLWSSSLDHYNITVLRKEAQKKKRSNYTQAGQSESLPVKENFSSSGTCAPDSENSQAVSDTSCPDRRGSAEVGRHS